jgi:hypothetical protein
LARKLSERVGVPVETKKSLIGYVQFTAWHTTASTFLYETLINRSTLLGAERLQAILAVAFQEV